MQIGVVSDTHGNHGAVEQVVRILVQRGISVVLHCGDIEDAPTVKLFENFTTHFVLGNCDLDVAGLRRAIKEVGATLHEPFGHIDLAGRKIAWMHGHDKRLMVDVENSGHFDFVFFGHTHKAERRQAGLTTVVNPGALYRANPKSFVILDLANGKLESVVIPQGPPT
jgi:putative phosphoesterase